MPSYKLLSGFRHKIVWTLYLFLSPIFFNINLKSKAHKAKAVPSSSSSSIDIRNKNSILFKNANKAMESGARLEIKFIGGRNFNLKKLVEMGKEEIADRKHALKKFAESEEGDISDS